MIAQTVHSHDQPFLLLEHRWFNSLEEDLRSELAAFADVAAAYDEEAGFTKLPALTGTTAAALRDPGHPRFLVVWLLPSADGSSAGRRLAALLALGGVDGGGSAPAAFVVAPELRSRGIATLLVEELTQQAADGDPQGITALVRSGVAALSFEAAGPHPAAQRLARRFGVKQQDERWQVLHLLRGPAARPELFDRPEVFLTERREELDLDPGVVRERSFAAAIGSRQSRGATCLLRRSHRLAAAPHATLLTRTCLDGTGAPTRLAFAEWVPDAPGPTGTQATTAELDAELDALVGAALSHLSTEGVRAVLTDIDASDSTVVRGFRRNSFQHDQSNLSYTVSLRDVIEQALA